MDIFDIARLAGVSRKTVQRVLNAPEQVKAETRERILAIMQEHQYEPNVSARRLTKKKTHTMGLFLVQDPGKHAIYTDDLFYSVVIGAMISACGERGYNVLVTTASVNDPSPIYKLYREKSIDAGLIVSWTNVQDIVDHLTEASFIVGVFDQHTLTRIPENVPVPLLNNEKAAANAVRHLIELYKSPVGIIGGDPENGAAIERQTGAEQALAEAGIPLQPDHLKGGAYTEQAGYDAVTEWLQAGTLPQTLFCFNDVIALGAMRALKEAGKSIPGDVSIIGFDDILLARFAQPSLTTMTVPRVEMTVAIVEQLIALIEGDPLPVREPFIPELTIRESTSRKQLSR